MSKYHIHPATGVPDLCKAVVKSCPFGTDEEHYATKQEAREAFEQQMKNEIIISNTKPSFYNSGVSLALEEMSENADGDTKDILHNLSMKIGKAKNQEDFNKLRVIVDQTKDYYGDSGKNKEYLALVIASNILNHGYDIMNTDYYKSELEKNIEEIETKIALNPLNNTDRVKQALMFNRKQLEMYERIDSKKKFAELLKQQKNAFIEKFESGDYPDHKSFWIDDIHEMGAHEITIVDSNGDEKTIREILSDKNNVYTGRVRDVETATKIMDQNADKLVSHFCGKNGDFAPPENFVFDEGGEINGESEFVFLDGGAELNVYLHEPTQIVYKIPHNKTRFDEGTDGKKWDMKTAFLVNQKRYAQLDSEKLEEIDVEYCPTYFLNPKDKNGNEIPIIAQPYLDEEVYVSYRPLDSTLKKLSEMKLNDLHAGNIKLNSKTGKIVLFDCLLDTDLED